MQTQTYLVFSAVSYLVVACSSPSSAIRASPSLFEGATRPAVRETPSEAGRNLSLFLYARSVGLDSYGTERLNGSVISDDDFDFENAKLSAQELRIRWGGSAVGLVVGIGRQGLEANRTDDGEVGETDLDAFGLTLGCDGFPHLGQAGSGFAMDYSLGLSAHFLDGDVTIGGGGSKDLESANGFAVTARLGPGFEVRDWQLSTGVTYTTLRAEYTVEDSTDEEEDLSAWSSDVGAYLRAAFLPSRSPFFGAIEGVFGGITGFGVSLGMRF
jgi:hypothetical protein